ncbi:MAG: hypothetical protein ACYCQH_04595 [Acidithiobacillus ferrooxidans]|jgi:hypothetical protein|uniref:Uncharacterized protein n=1 Tax=mine drainage metagenome TaxID=410659 RepID=E6QC27_9ZZZZ
MEYLAKKHGLWLEGAYSRLRLITPAPIVLPFGLNGYVNGNIYVFCEDYFDSATRVRRGRLYQSSGRNGDHFENVSLFPYPTPSNGCPIDEIYETANLNIKAGQEVILGDNLAQTYWTVVLAERRGRDAYYITLKSKTFLAVLPELLPNEIPEKNISDIINALNAVVETATMQAPQSVIDACRNAASHMISAKFPESNPNGKADLGPLVKWLIDQSKLKKCTDAADSLLYLLEASTSHLVNQLHSRGKANAAAAHGTRPVSQRDADLAVSAIAFLLQDFGWAANEG